VRAAALCGLALAAFSYLRVFWLALVLVFMVGGGLILAAASTNTILHTIVDDRLRGRVASFYTLAFLGMAPLGNLATGALAAHVGTQMTFLLDGVIAAFGAVWFWRQLPSMRQKLRPIYRELGILSEQAPPRAR
jgi:dipeptide/tripeptide permease